MGQPDFKEFSGPRGRPTQAERRLIEASAAGEIADVSEFAEAERTVSAALIAAIATGRFRHRDWKDWALHEMGLMLVGANIPQHLDIRRRRIPGPLMFARCAFAAGIDLDNAAIEGDLWLIECSVLGGLRLGNARISGGFNANQATIANKDGDAIFAQGVKAVDWFMDGATVNGRFVISSAEIAGQFNANGTAFENAGGDAIFAQGVKAGSHWFMNRATVKGRFDINGADIAGQFGANGTAFENEGSDAIFAPAVKAVDWFMDGATVKGRFVIRSAEIAGQFSANGTTFENGGGDAIWAQRVKAVDWFMNGATVKGRFDINGAEIAGQFLARETAFENEGGDAIFAQGVKAAGWFMNGATVNGRFAINDANIAGHFVANGATFENEGGDAIWAQRVKAVDWFMNGATVKGRFDINGAEIAGQFSAVGTAYENESGDAIFAQGVKAGSHWFMNGATVKGRFDIAGAEIAGQFAALEASFENEDGDAILAQAVKAVDWFMNGATVKGRFDIAGAEIAGQFSANEHGGKRVTFENPRGEALHAYNVKTAGWRMNGATLRGTVILAAAKITGTLNLNETTIEREGGDAVLAYSLKAAACFMDGASVRGGINLNGAEFAGQFSADGASFDNPNGVALIAPFARFGGSLFIAALEEKDKPKRHPRIAGGIDLGSTEISKGLAIQDATITASRGRAISLQEAIIDGPTTFQNSTVIGHIHANRARFNGRLSFKGMASIVAATTARARGQLPEKMGDAYHAVDEERQHRFRHHAIALQEARIDGRLVMPDSMPEGIVDLTRARCDMLEDSSEGWPPALPRGDRDCGDRCLPIDAKGTLADIRHLILDGFEYQHIEFPSGGREGREAIAPARVRWLTGQPAEDLVSHFNPQPWRQAASALRTMGHDEAARSVSIEQRVRQRLAADTPRFQRAVSWTLHTVADYGFNPWKTVGIALALVLVCAILFRLGLAACGGHGGLSESRCEGGPAYTQVVYGDLEGANRDTGPYPAFNALIYSLDRLLPIPDLGMESYWRPNTEATLPMRHPLLKVAGRVVVGGFPIGSLLYLVSMIEAFLGAILVAIAVTGFTGLLTRDQK